MHKLFFAVITCFIALAARAGGAYIENKGQVTDQFRKPNPEVLYLYTGNKLNLQLRKTGFSYDIWSLDAAASKMIFNRVDLRFLNTDPRIRLTQSGRSADYLNYYTEYAGTDGIKQVHSYDRVTYINVWAGIDIEFLLTDDGATKYNFIVHPGAAVSDIKLDIKGADKIITGQNGLLMQTAISVVQENLPESYFTYADKKVHTQASFAENNDGTYGIKVADAIPAGAVLVIDPLPIIKWGTFYGGASADESTCSIPDKFGNVYLCGYSYSTGAIATAGSFQSALSVNEDCFIAKFNSNGVRIWGTYYGGSGGTDYASVIALDSLHKQLYVAVTPLLPRSSLHREHRKPRFLQVMTPLFLYSTVRERGYGAPMPAATDLTTYTAW